MAKLVIDVGEAAKLDEAKLREIMEAAKRAGLTVEIEDKDKERPARPARRHFDG